MSPRALEDCPSADPGFEACPDEDCDGHLSSRTGMVRCTRCGRRPEEVEEERAEADEGEGEA